MTTSPNLPFRRRDVALAAILLLLVVLAYFPAIDGGRLLDDDLHITRSGLRTIAGLGRIWFEPGATQQYYPVLHSAFWIEHRLWGDCLAGYHAVNLLLHATSAFLIVVLMRRLRLRGAWLAAFLFALHPVGVESVAWIAEQKNTLATALALGAAIVHLEFDQTRRKGAGAIALALFVLALLSKTAVVAMPLALAALIWWRRGEFRWRRDGLPLAPWLAVGAAVALVTLFVEHRLLAGVGASFVLSPIERGLLAGRALWFYAFKLVVPAHLTFFYPRWTIDALDGWQYLFPAATVVVAVGAWRLAATGRRGPLATLLCFAAALLPVLGFFNLEWFVFAFVADHLEYLAAVAFVIPAAAALMAAAKRLPATGAQAATTAATCALIGVLGVLTWNQCRSYRTAETLYRSTIRRNPTSAAAHNNLGTVLAAMPGRNSDAIAEFEAALRLNPRVAEGQENLGSALMRDPPRFDEGVAHLELAQTLEPGRKSVRDQLAFAFADRPGRSDEAIAEFEVSLHLDPADAAVHNGLGRVLLRDPRRFEEAVAEFETAIRLKPEFSEAHNNLGDAWLRMPGRLRDAMAEIQEALRLNPELAGAHNNLGLALARSGAPVETAMVQFETALRLDPNHAGAHCNLGLALTLVPGRRDEAIAQLREGVRLDPGFAPGWLMLGRCLLQAGDGADAEAAFRSALQLAPDNEAARQGLDAALRHAAGG